MSRKMMILTILKLVAIIAMQQQQILIFKRQRPRPKLRLGDRLFWVLCSRLFKNLWRQALSIVKPETVISWHRSFARLHWRWISRQKSRKPKIPQETRQLVLHMASQCKIWGAEKIRGELLKLGIRLAKATIQKIIRPLRTRPDKVRSQNWRTFLANHSHEIWTADFFTATTLGFKQLYVFVVFAIHTREILHWNVTSHPSAEWSYQQILQATWDRKSPRFLICDRDSKYGHHFTTNLRKRLRIKVKRTPFRAPKANAFAERCIGSIRRECLDHMIIFSEDHLRGVLNEYIDYYNSCRPHQGIKQKIPAEFLEGPQRFGKGRIRCRPILNGLHHHYFRQAA